MMIKGVLDIIDLKFGGTESMIEAKYAELPDTLDIDDDSRGIPFEFAFEPVRVCTYASTEKVMYEMLSITGCRESELENMEWQNVFIKRIKDKIKFILYWKLGKNQKGWRHEELPHWYIKELEAYKATHKTFGSRIFSMTGDSFHRRFNRFIRPLLSPEWRIKIPVFKKGEFGEEHKLQLKGLRKNYQTLEFAKELEKWGSPEIALEMTSKKMRHASTGITCRHYFVNFKTLDIEKYKHMTISQIMTSFVDGQECIINWIS